MTMQEALGNPRLTGLRTYLPSFVPLKSSPFSKPFISETEYWKHYYDHPEKVYEWQNGYLQEKMMSEQITYLTYLWHLELVNFYLKTHPIAELAGLEMGFRLVLPDEVDIRKPDLGVVLKSNPVPLLPHESSYQGTFDICIEALSQSNADMIKRDTVTKKAEYALAGVKEYFILDGNQRYSEFYRLSTNGLYVPIKPLKGGIIKSKVLPGFQFRIDDLYQKPSPDEMINDPVYQGFVLPGYHEEKRARKEAEQRAQTELRARQKADQRAQRELKARQKAEQRAEQMAEKLRALGIDPDKL
jgi:hypothetical protein